MRAPAPAPPWIRLAAAAVRRLPFARYRVANLLAGMAAVDPFLARLPAASGGFTYLCDLQDGIAREVCFTGQYEPQETTLVRHLLSSGDVFVDVGANWGYFTLLAASQVGPAGRVASFEADPRLCRLLRDNVTRNALEHVRVFCVAAAAQAGELTLLGYDETQPNRGLSRLVSAGEGPAFFRVQADALDAVLDRDGIDRVDLVKIDVEGAEDLVLAGMRRGLTTHRYRRLLIEWHPAALAERGVSADPACAELREAGYVGYSIDHTPAAHRQAAYSRSLQARDMLQPFGDRLATTDAWPHTFWELGSGTSRESVSLEPR